MNRQIQPSELMCPGLYFTCKCRLSDCPSRSKSTLYYIGVSGEIDFAEAWKECKCGVCGNVMGSVSSVGFFRCRWSYRGVVETGEEQREELHYTYGFTVCTGPKRFKWKSLALAAWELTQEEQEAAHTRALAALEAPRKRRREEGRREAGEKREVDTQTEQTSFPIEGAEQMSESLITSDHLIKQLKATISMKEERYLSLQTQVNSLLSQLSSLKPSV